MMSWWKYSTVWEANIAAARTAVLNGTLRHESVIVRFQRAIITNHRRHRICHSPVSAVHIMLISLNVYHYQQNDALLEAQFLLRG
jgi:hypothetical protein